MEKKKENDMEAGFYRGLWGSYGGSLNPKP